MRTPLVFLGRPSTLSEHQGVLYDTSRSLIASHGFDLLEITRDRYTAALWTQMRDAVASSHGAALFGFRQLFVSEGCQRPHTRECRPAPEWHASPWVQIEAGLAVMAAVPMLVLAEDGVETGVFEPAVWVDGVVGARLTSSKSGCSSRAVDEWATRVWRRARGQVP